MTPFDGLVVEFVTLIVNFTGLAVVVVYSEPGVTVSLAPTALEIASPEFK